MAVDAHAGAGGAEPAGGWAEVEQRFFADIKKKQRQQDDDRELEYAQATGTLGVRLESLGRERVSLERKLRAVTEEMAAAEDELAQHHDQYQLHLNKVSLERRAQYESLQSHFRDQRAEGPIDVDFINQIRAVGPAVAPPPPPGTRPPNMDMVQQDGDLTGAEVVDSEGELIGPIKKIPAHNHWIDIMLDLDVRQPVYIRRGRKFTKANLDVIYEKTDAKCSKWIACMIQATGIVQVEACVACYEAEGPFAQCVKAQGNEFVKCGNCEWNKLACHGASAARSVTGAADPANGPYDAAMTDADYDRWEGAAVNTVVHRPIAPAPGRGPPSGGAPGPAGTAAGPSWTTVNPRAASFAAASSGYGPAPPAPAASSTAANSPAASDDTPELTEQEKEELVKPPLVMRHDGHFYTYPDFMEGVPLEKITPSHPYWDPTWKEPIDATQRVLTSYEEKHAEALRMDIKNTKFLLGRQVRRGHSIIKFLQTGPISPYQLVSKKYMLSGIVTYDTLFRLVNTVEELEKFKIDVTPLEWLRHRLYELMLAQADKFNLAKTVKDLYHDEKLGKLRKLSGFGNIGRPSGGRDTGPRAARRKDSSGNTPTRPYRKRPKLQQTASTDTVTSSLRGELGWSSAVRQRVDVLKMQDDGGGGGGGGGATLATTTAPPPPPPPPTLQKEEAEDEFAYDGCTDTESLSGQMLHSRDYQVKSVRTTRYQTAPDPDLRYYWHSDDDGELDLQVWEHKTKSWCVFESPVDFLVPCNDVIDVRHHPDSAKVLVRLHCYTETSGCMEMMAEFLRERTKKRYLAMFRDSKCTMKVAPSPADLDAVWDEFGKGAETLTADGLRV